MNGGMLREIGAEKLEIVAAATTSPKGAQCPNNDGEARGSALGARFNKDRAYTFAHSHGSLWKFGKNTGPKLNLAKSRSDGLLQKHGIDGFTEPAEVISVA
jgi:hypothetical protein